MTLFLMVLKELIREQLNATSETLKSQTQSWGYNHSLSLQKKNVINILDKKISDFEGTGNDENDAQEIVKLLEGEHGIEKIQKKQEEHGESRDESKTLDTLSKLSIHTKALYKKLNAFNDVYDGNDKLCLINRPFINRPENILYYHSAYYFGQEIFSPMPGIDLVIRAEKEESIRARLQSLSERIRPDFGLKECREKTLDTLRDLSMDNKNIIKPKTTSSFGLPFFSIGGVATVKFPTDLFNPREGRFGERFSLALSLVKEMTESDFELLEEKADLEVSH